jgi:hypothetical protein
MSRTLRALVTLAVLFASARSSAAPPAARISARDAVFEEKITRELEAMAPDAVPIFKDATAALDANDPAKAAALYARVIELAPNFTHAKRRECSALDDDGKRTAALPFCRAALAQERSPENEAALASVLLSTEGEKASASDAQEAKRLAEAATAAKPDEPYVWSVLFRAGMATEDRATMRRASERLVAIAPDDVGTQIIAVLAALAE